MNLVRVLKKSWNMKEIVIAIVVVALGTIPQNQEKRLDELEISGRIETKQTTALQKSIRILRRVLDTRGDLLSLKLL